MVNFVYLIGDKETGEAVIVDPAYDIKALIDILEEDDMKCKGVLATHYHPDHVGGSMMGYNIVGVKELLEQISVPIHAQKEEAEFITKVTGLESKDVM
ncbi:MAG TPA: MBL fold metallo-hydrolase, partial [Acidimicrobiaceae bacterium]|nr:MBL fold metallo-hydrolase [Acidimicrobiaceae bacterium]